MFTLYQIALRAATKGCLGKYEHPSDMWPRRCFAPWHSEIATKSPVVLKPYLVWFSCQCKSANWCQIEDSIILYCKSRFQDYKDMKTLFAWKLIMFDFFLNVLIFRAIFLAQGLIHLCIKFSRFNNYLISSKKSFSFIKSDSKCWLLSHFVCCIANYACSLQISLSMWMTVLCKRLMKDLFFDYLCKYFSCEWKRLFADIW